jgi:hypothetical protein
MARQPRWVLRPQPQQRQGVTLLAPSARTTNHVGGSVSDKAVGHGS